MEIALVLAILAAAVFAAAFIKDQPAWSLVPAGLAVFAAAFAIYIYEAGIK